ncbi:hypothetical protein H0E87_008328 [Populus deltoides]|uniref:Uncharacterized protein n=1 Tax=Populus deltoides TaxID=3696 RepID=A0A8T2Z085_POPDE|nr:hypothetical protein H0E87_008328 [Populus deltoides]
MVDLRHRREKADCSAPVGAAAAAATAGGRSWRPRRCDEETLLLRRSEEGAGCPLSSSLVPATEREKKLLWFKGHRKMRAELGGGRSVEDGLCGDWLVMFLAEGEEKKVCVQRGGRSVWPRVRATKGKMAGAKMGVGSSCGERGRGRVLCSLVSALKMSENGGNGDGWFGRVWGRWFWPREKNGRRNGEDRLRF